MAQKSNRFRFQLLTVVVLTVLLQRVSSSGTCLNALSPSSFTVTAYTNSVNNGNTCCTFGINTGINVVLGSSLVITATGEWTMDDANYVGANGQSTGTPATAYNYSAEPGTLVGVINGVAFTIGTSYVNCNMSLSGILYLWCWDSNYGDNQGQMAVKINYGFANCPNNCSGHGTCNSLYTGALVGSCSCNSGYSGPTCNSTCSCAYANQECGVNGVCQCKSGWTGATCATAAQPCSSTGSYSVVGDSHVTTFDGTHFNFFGVGTYLDFSSTASNGNTVVISSCHIASSVAPSTSVIKAVSIQDQGDVFTVFINSSAPSAPYSRLLYNGALQTVSSLTTSLLSSFNIPTPDTYVFTLIDSVSITVNVYSTYIDLYTSLTSASYYNKTSGLSGSWDCNVQNDYTGTNSYTSSILWPSGGVFTCPSSATQPTVSLSQFSTATQNAATACCQAIISAPTANYNQYNDCQFDAAASYNATGNCNSGSILNSSEYSSLTTSAETATYFPNRGVTSSGPVLGAYIP